MKWSGVFVVALCLVGCDKDKAREMFNTESRQERKENRERKKAAQEDMKKARERAKENDLTSLIQFAFKDAQTTFEEMYRTQRPKERYIQAKLVLFKKSIDTACGKKVLEEGPVHCSHDHTTYIDLAFFDELARRYGAKGKLLPAFTVAHELGHHLQNISGISVKKSQIPTDLASQNALSVRTELQADCFAGVWGHSAVERKQLVELNEIETAIRAEGAMGSDKTQKAGADPRTFTHGTAEQRMRWIKIGLESGRLDKCDTFAPDVP